jgi:hypothetical protein
MANDGDSNESTLECPFVQRGESEIIQSPGSQLRPARRESGDSSEQLVSFRRLPRNFVASQSSANPAYRE